MRTDEQGKKMKKGTKEVQRREGEGGEQDNAESAVFTHVEVGCVCNEMLASIRLRLVPPHPNTIATTTTTTTLHLPHQAD